MWPDSKNKYDPLDHLFHGSDEAVCHLAKLSLDFDGIDWPLLQTLVERAVPCVEKIRQDESYEDDLSRKIYNFTQNKNPFCMLISDYQFKINIFYYHNYWCYMIDANDYIYAIRHLDQNHICNNLTWDYNEWVKPTTRRYYSNSLAYCKKLKRFHFPIHVASSLERETCKQWDLGGDLLEYRLLKRFDDIFKIPLDVFCDLIDKMKRIPGVVFHDDYGHDFDSKRNAVRHRMACLADRKIQKLPGFFKIAHQSNLLQKTINQKPNERSNHHKH